MAHSYLSKSGTAQMLHLLADEPGHAVGRMNPARLERLIAEAPLYIAALQEVLDAARTEVRKRETSHDAGPSGDTGPGGGRGRETKCGIDTS